MGDGAHRFGVPKGRVLLAQVVAKARPFIDVQTAVAVLKVDPKAAARRLARWHEQGFLRRIRRGVYAVVPPSAVLHERIVVDPWLIVPTVFRRGYVAGWSAAEYWDLTEQIFKTLLVCTTDSLKRTDLRVAGIDVRARHVSDTLWFGTATVWRDATRVLVSDVHKTLVDMCVDVSLGGGIQHVAHCFSIYLRRDDADTKKLFAYAVQTKSAAALKRLGFVCELIDGPLELRAACLQAVTLGLAKLDPAIASPRVSRRWQLRLPDNWERLFKDG